MLRFQCSFQSKVLNIPTTVTVNLPFPVFGPLSLNGSLDDLYRFGKKFKTLYMLHWAFSDSSIWFQVSRVGEYAGRHGLAVVMPSVENSFYAGLLHDAAYWTYVPFFLYQISGMAIS